MYMNPISSLLQPDNLFVEFSFSFSFDEKKLYDQISFKIHENIIMRPSLNKAYRPNAHLLDIFMQLKYQFAVRTRFRISIK